VHCSEVFSGKILRTSSKTGARDIKKREGVIERKGTSE